jgi:hypothetical protein
VNGKKQAAKIAGMLAACAPTFYAARELRFFDSVRNVIEHSSSKFLRSIAF